MSFSCLPREIILVITDHLDHVGMNALLCTNSQVYDFLNKDLYRQDISRPQSKSLIWAAKLGVEGTVRQAIYAGGHFNPVPESFHIALQIAADRGHAHLVEMLLKVDNINPNFRDTSLEYKAAPIGLAARRGHSVIVELLLAADNIDPNVKDQHSFTPLYWACKMGHVRVVKQLLARDDVNFNPIEDGRTQSTSPLTVACIRSHTKIIHLLLAKDGIRVNFNGDIHGDTPLMMAVKRGLVGVVKSLLSRDDLEPNIVNNGGHHVLETAAGLGHIGIVKLLLDHPDIDPNFASRDGRTALMQADRPDVVKLLLGQDGIDINQQDNSGWTALCMAACFRNFEAAKILLEREDVNINLPDNSGWTPLFWACNHNCLQLVDLLLEKADIDPNPRDTNSGRTPLAHVCHYLGYEAVAVVRSLLSHPATDPNAVNNNGVSILADYITRWHPTGPDVVDSTYQQYYDMESLLCS